MVMSGADALVGPHWVSTPYTPDPLGQGHRPSPVVYDSMMSAQTNSSPQTETPDRAAPGIAVWGPRLGWIAVGILGGAAVWSTAPDDSSLGHGALLLCATAAWLAVSFATWLPGPLGLTVTRLGSASACALTGLAALVDTSPLTAAALAASGACLVAMLTPQWGEWHANGPAYPNERRMPLRPAAVVQWLLLPLVGLVGAIGAWPGLWRWADGHTNGLVAAVLGAALTAGAALTFQPHTRRWLVFVPAGFVIADGIVLSDPTLFPRALVSVATPATADELNDPATLDLTTTATGLVISFQLEQNIDVGVRRGREVEAKSIRAILVAPTRPGQVLAEARLRRIG